MAVSIPVVHSSSTDRHDVPTGIFCGVAFENDERPMRAAVSLEAFRRVGAPIHEATQHGIEAIARVHDRRFLDVMAQIHDWWMRDGEPPGNPYVTPYYFPPVAGERGGRIERPATTSRAEIGRYAMDTMTLIGDGTWEGSVAAVDAALTAADFVLAGSRAAYAISRPPGHHAGPAFFGGSCYLNNASVAVADLRANDIGRVALIDIDAHHGNGSQAIFWNDSSVMYASVHIDPAAGWFPHTVGYADEVDDTGTNLNLPVAPGTDDSGWLEALDRLIASVVPFAPEAVVVSLGVDAATEDLNSPLLVTADGFAAAGRRLADLDLPTVLVLEGGYVLETLGALTVSVVEAFC